MIPLKLQIKNFLSYGPELQTIDFGPYPLICLSGKNGHGKSALLDAITWALWGQARKVSGTSKADQGLLRLGQTNMMVILDFALDDQVYRVKREYSIIYSKPHANLEFGIVQNNDTAIIPLTDKTIRETQKKIENTIHIDFDSFVNSAFLRQGNSNEFSKKSSKDRKEILATILGLNQYENLRKRALEKIREASNYKQALTTLQEKLTAELETKEIINTSIVTINHDLDTLHAQEKKHKTDKNILEKKIEVYADQQKQHELLIFKLNQLVESEQEQQNSVRELTKKWRSTHAQQRKLADLTELETNKQQLIHAINQHQKLLQQQLEHKEQLLKLKGTLQQLEQSFYTNQAHSIQQKKLELERALSEKQHTHTKIGDLEKQYKIYTQELTQLLLTIENLEAQKELNKNVLTQLEATEKQFERRKEYYQKYVALGNWVTSELESLKQKSSLVHNEQDPSCPLCDQNLSASRRRFLKQKFTHTESSLKTKRNRLAHTVKKLKTVLVAQHEHLTILKKQQEKSVSITATIDQHIQQKQKLTALQEKVLLETQEAQKAVIAYNKNIEVATQNITKIETVNKAEFLSSASYQQTVQKIDSIGKIVEENSYNSQAHQKTQQELMLLEKQLTEYTDIKKETAQQQQRKESIHVFCKKLKIIKKQKHILNAEQKTYGTLSEQKITLSADKKNLEQEIKATQKQKEELLQKKGSLLTQQDKFTQIEQELKAQQKEINTLTHTIDDYHAISAATSKDGIQALLIEDTIPEIEQEANRLLAKLTNNQAQLFIESLRDLKKGGTKETLDIKISDTMGIRPYELFSGGEAFRIDFALRIAISKLLARRAGTALQTLIIDEGFGSQDEEGLSNIMDAIYKIQDDFSKVIIVSHLTSMKDQFPVHFMVEKGANGSKVIIMEQG